MKVTVGELRRISNLLFDHLEGLGQKEFSIEEDFYWNIPEEELYNSYKEPTSLDIGQLSEDIDKVRNLESDPSLRVGVGFVWLAAILRRIGEKSLG